MMDLLAALILLGAPAAALFAIRCAIRPPGPRRSRRLTAPGQLVGGSYVASG